MIDKRICFVIAPIEEINSAARKRYSRVFEHLIRPATRKCGYSAIRALDFTHPGLITAEILKHIASDPLVIADLTDGDPNVFYELALRHAVRKPVIQLVAKGQRIPFDVVDTRTISFDMNDVVSTKEATHEIIKAIRDIERSASPIETPVSSIGADIWTPFPGIEKHQSLEDVTFNLKALAALSPAEAIPEIVTYIEKLYKNPNLRLLGTPIDDLDAACLLVERVPYNGILLGQSSLQDQDADERDSYRTAVNRALENNVTYHKVICSSRYLTSQRHEKWLGEFTDKAELKQRLTELGSSWFVCSRRNSMDYRLPIR